MTETSWTFTTVVELSAARNALLSAVGPPWALWSSLMTTSVTAPLPTAEKMSPNIEIRMIGKISEKNNATGLRRYVRETIRRSAAMWRPFMAGPPT